MIIASDHYHIFTEPDGMITCFNNIHNVMIYQTRQGSADKNETITI